VLEWHRRLQQAYTFYQGNDPCLRLKNFAAQEGVTHVLLEAGNLAMACPGLEPLYQDATYSVYAIKP
jgi:hypothetical protein